MPERTSDLLFSIYKYMKNKKGRFYTSLVKEQKEDLLWKEIYERLISQSCPASKPKPQQLIIIFSYGPIKIVSSFKMNYLKKIIINVRKQNIVQRNSNTIIQTFFLENNLDASDASALVDYK